MISSHLVFMEVIMSIGLRINFKILLIPFKALQGQAREYSVSDLLSPYQPVHNLRSSSRNLLTVPTSCLKTKGDWTFDVRAPQLWKKTASSLLCQYFLLYHLWRLIFIYQAFLCSFFVLTSFSHLNVPILFTFSFVFYL